MLLCPPMISLSQQMAIIFFSAQTNNLESFLAFLILCIQLNSKCCWPGLKLCLEFNHHLPTPPYHPGPGSLNLLLGFCISFLSGLLEKLYLYSLFLSNSQRNSCKKDELSSVTPLLEVLQWLPFGSVYKVIFLYVYCYLIPAVP